MTSASDSASRSKAHRFTKCFRHIDDATQITVMSGREFTRRAATEAGAIFVKTLEEQGVIISDKSAVVASTFSLAKEVADSLNAQGIRIDAQECAEDLGMSTSSGAKRNMKS